MFQPKINFRLFILFFLPLVVALSGCEDERTKKGGGFNPVTDAPAAPAGSNDAPALGDPVAPPTPQYRWQDIEQRINDANGEFIYVVQNSAAANGLEILFGGRGFKVASPYTNGFATVKDSLSKGGLLDSNGNLVLPLIYEKIGLVDAKGLIEVALRDSSGNLKEGILDATGKAVVPIEYDIADQVQGTDLFKVGNGKKGREKFGLLNEKGEEILPVKYSAIGIFSEGFATVKEGSKYGFIDALGRVAVEPKYEMAFPIRYGASWVKENGVYILLDQNLNEVNNETYQAFATLEYIEAAQNIHNDDYGTTLPQVKSQTFATPDSSIGCAQNGKWGVIDTKGNVVLPFEYLSLGIKDGTWYGK